MTRIHAGIFLLSGAIVAYQLVLMQILSSVQWYHFAYMVISVALLGFGAAGTFLALFENRLGEGSARLLPVLMLATGLSMAAVVGISQQSLIRFDSYLLFSSSSRLWRLACTYVLFFIPFFFGALAIGWVFVRHVDSIGSLYCVNLVGSGAGGIVAVVLMWYFSPAVLPAVVGSLSVVSGAVLLPGKPGTGLLTAVVLSFLAVLILSLHPPRLYVSEFKDISRTLDLTDAVITHEQSSPYGLIQIVTSPALRYAPGLSLTYDRNVPRSLAVFNNGNWFGPVVPGSRTRRPDVLDYTTHALPYVMTQRNSVLILGARTGFDALQAQEQGAEHVTLVEPNPVMRDLMVNGIAGAADSLFREAEISLHSIAPRAFLARDTTRYDLITMPVVGSFGGNSGLYALQAQYSLTEEAFREMWLKLTPEGVIGITCWMDYPARKPLKIIATLVEVLSELNIQNPARHIAAILSWGTITYVVKKSPVSAEEIRNIRDFSNRMLFDPVILPGENPVHRAENNSLHDEQFFDNLEKILSPQRDELYATYVFDIKPATDDRPYFSQFLRLRSIPYLANLYGNRAIPFFEIGSLIIFLTLLQMTAAAIVLIAVPLVSIGWRGRGTFRIMLYFSGIGAGYMFIEIIFIQRFILYFGNPVYSAAAVISAMLVCSGFGSYVSRKLAADLTTFRAVAGIIIILLIIYTTVLAPILQATGALPVAAKAGVAFFLIALPAFFMGIPFPLGLRGVAERNKPAVPWAWGINGCISVISAVLATMIAVEAGFTVVILLAAAAYCLPLTANI